jgi:hypothetical protein
MSQQQQPKMAPKSVPNKHESTRTTRSEARAKTKDVKEEPKHNESMSQKPLKKKGRPPGVTNVKSTSITKKEHSNAIQSSKALKATTNVKIGDEGTSEKVMKDIQNEASNKHETIQKIKVEDSIKSK